MDTVLFEDLKQFISVTVGQAIAEMNERFERVNARFDEIDKRFKDVDERFDEVLSAIGDTMSVTNNDIDKQLASHTRRITKLERRPAH